MATQKNVVYTKNNNPETVSVRCATCNRETAHRVEFSLEAAGEEWDRAEEWSVSWKDKYQVVQCQGCKTVSFRHVNWNSESEDPVTGNPGETENLYPYRSADSITSKDFPHFPCKLMLIYEQLVDCFNRGSRILCAAGLRALVEGICAAQNIVDGPVQVSAKGGGTRWERKKNLEGLIEGLKEKGLVTAAHALMLHEHRYLGNAAVHELDEPTSEELRLAIEIVEHTLDQLYGLSEKANRLRRATAKRKNKKPGFGI